MVEVLIASAATENSRLIDVSPVGPGKYVLEVVDGGSWSGTIKIAARAHGRGREAGATTFPIYLPIVKLDDNSVIAAATGITAPGLYLIDLSGLEARLEHTRVAGSVSVFGEPYEP